MFVHSSKNQEPHRFPPSPKSCRVRPARIGFPSDASWPNSSTLPGERSSVARWEAQWPWTKCTSNSEKKSWTPEIRGRLWISEKYSTGFRVDGTNPKNVLYIGVHTNHLLRIVPSTLKPLYWDRTSWKKTIRRPLLRPSSAGRRLAYPGGTFACVQASGRGPANLVLLGFEHQAKDLPFQIIGYN